MVTRTATAYASSELFVVDTGVVTLFQASLVECLQVRPADIASRTRREPAPSSYRLSPPPIIASARSTNLGSTYSGWSAIRVAKSRIVGLFRSALIEPLRNENIIDNWRRAALAGSKCAWMSVSETICRIDTRDIKSHTCGTCTFPRRKANSLIRHRILDQHICRQPAFQRPVCFVPDGCH